MKPNVDTTQKRKQAVATKRKAILNVYRKLIIDASRNLAAFDQDPSEFCWFSYINEDTRDYFYNLTEFIARNESSGRELVLRVCNNSDYAKWLAEEENTPKPVKFLAQHVTHLGKSC